MTKKERAVIFKACEACGGEGWVCEDHPNKAWGEGDGCCGGAGIPCKCNTSKPPWHHGMEGEKYV